VQKKYAKPAEITLKNKNFKMLILLFAMLKICNATQIPPKLRRDAINGRKL